MDGHQLRGARIHRDMMLVSSVCRRALGCEWGGGERACIILFFAFATLLDRLAAHGTHSTQSQRPRPLKKYVR